jgi:low temperature requirement protein LtrA
MDVSDQGGVPPARIRGEQRVTPLELFFDLVFVFALTQVTGFLADHLTWVGMLQGGALLMVLWAAWGGYSWLTNAVPAEEAIPARLVIFLAMAAMFVASLAVPGAFGRYGVIFGSAYFVVQLLQVILYALATGREPERRAILRLAPGFAQGALWAIALCGGVVLYLLGHNAFRLREEGSVSVPRLVVAVVCLGLIVVWVSVSSNLTLAVLVLVLCGLAAFETATSGEFRRELRAR